MLPSSTCDCEELQNMTLLCQACKGWEARARKGVQGFRGSSFDC